MNKFIKVIVYSLGILLLVVFGFLTYVKLALPDVGPPPDIKIEATAEKIQRGSYLAHHVTLCIDCHSTRDWSYFAGPMVAGTEGKGGETFDQHFGFPGKYVAPNITPFHLHDWTDGEIFRAVTSGVSKDGRALFPIMPHLLYGQLDKNDIEAIIAYIRTLKPIENKTEISSSDFPMNFIINTIPKKPSFTKIPPQSDQLSYGKYIAYGLPDKIIFSFNTKDYKMPKGVTFDFEDGSQKKTAAEKEKLKNQKGKMEIVISGYIINKGIADSVFN